MIMKALNYGRSSLMFTKEAFFYRMLLLAVSPVPDILKQCVLFHPVFAYECIGYICMHRKKKLLKS